MRKVVPSFAFLAASFLLSSSCNKPFNPTGPVDQHLVVFTILSTHRSVQFVRVTAPFLPVDFDPASKNLIDNTVTDASVDIVTPSYYAFDQYHRGYYVQGQRLRLRDTVLIRPDSAAFAFPLHVYTASPFTPQYGFKYDVFVVSPSHGQAWESVTFPPKPTLNIPLATRSVLDYPQQLKDDSPIVFLMTLADAVKGYIARLYIDYEVVKDGEWITERVEVPLSSADPASYSLAYPIYPVITQSVATNHLSITYKNGYLRSTIKKLTDVTYASDKIIFDRVIFMVLQADPNLYSYCAATQLEWDPRSIRLDQPPIARLSGGGYGLVGGYTLDSLVYPLSEYFYANRR